MEIKDDQAVSDSSEKSLSSGHLEKNKGGRPKKEIDSVLFDELIQLPLSNEDIAKCLRCHVDTVNAYCQERFGVSFSDCKEQNRQTFRKNILAKQYEMACKGDRVMLIWLGKQYLGQSEKTVIQGDEEKPLKLSYSAEQVRAFIGSKPTDN